MVHHDSDDIWIDGAIITEIIRPRQPEPNNCIVDRDSTDCEPGPVQCGPQQPTQLSLSLYLRVP
jgi:hypothetical protein